MALAKDAGQDKVKFGNASAKTQAWPKRITSLDEVSRTK